VSRRKLELDRSGPWIAAVGLLMELWCSIATGLFAPWWGVVLAFVLLVPQVWLVARWSRTHPRLTILVPLVGLALWAGLAWFGAVVWDWSA
jgi:hypothetical protein